MAYDILLADRVRQILKEKKTFYDEKKMMGGLCFLVDGKMCMGVDIDKATKKPRLMVRIGEDAYENALTRKGCSEFNITGKSMKGFVFVSAEAIDMQEELEYWVQLGLDFNPFAKSSKKKTNAIFSK